MKTLAFSIIAEIANKRDEFIRENPFDKPTHLVLDKQSLNDLSREADMYKYNIGAVGPKKFLGLTISVVETWNQLDERYIKLL